MTKILEIQGKKIKAQRLAMELSQTELAERIQVSQQAIQAWESGIRQPGAIAYLRLVKELGISPEFPPEVPNV